MDRLGAAWKGVEGRYGVELGNTDISARAIMGMALITALESHHGSGVDRDDLISQMAEGTIDGFFPTIAPKKRRRCPRATCGSERSLSTAGLPCGPERTRGSGT